MRQANRVLGTFTAIIIINVSVFIYGQHKCLQRNLLLFAPVDGEFLFLNLPNAGFLQNLSTYSITVQDQHHRGEFSFIKAISKGDEVSANSLQHSLSIFSVLLACMECKQKQMWSLPCRAP